MKTLFNTVLIFLLSARCVLLYAEEPKPTLPIREAIDIAEKARAVRESGDKVYVASIALERTSITSGKLVWFAKWSSPLPANNPMDREIGVQISMDGSVKRMIKGPGPARTSPR